MLASYLSTFRSFHRNVLLHVAAISLIGFTFDGGVFSVVFNLFLLRLGYGPAFVGQVNAAGLITFALCSLPAGALGNRWGSRIAMIRGLAVMMTASVALALTEFVAGEQQAAWLFATYMLAFVGLALYFVNTAPYLMGVAGKGQRNHAFSIQSAVISMAAFAGSLTGGTLPGIFAALLGLTLESAAPYRYPLLFAALMLNLGILALTKAGDGEAEPLPPAPRRSYPTGFRVPRFRGVNRRGVNLRKLSQGFVALLLVISVIRVLQIAGSAVTMTFFNVYMDDGLGAPTAQIGLMAGIGRLLGIPIVLALPLLSARWGNPRLIIFSCVSTAFFLLPMAWIADPWAAGIGYMGVMAGSSIRYTAFMVFAMELVKPAQRGIMSGVSEMTAGISFSLMALLGGTLIVTSGYAGLFVTAAVLTLAGAVIFALYFRQYFGWR